MGNVVRVSCAWEEGGGRARLQVRLHTWYKPLNCSWQGTSRSNACIHGTITFSCIGHETSALGMNVATRVPEVRPIPSHLLQNPRCQVTSVHMALQRR